MSEETVKKPDQKKSRKYPVDGYHSAEKCRGCPYGFKTYCVGICWKDAYLMPANIELAGLEVGLVNAMSRESVLKEYLSNVENNYDFILLDCMPSLGMLTINALAASDEVLIPVQAQYLPAKGLEQLLTTINKVKKQINPKLHIEGILLTMVEGRTNFSKDVSKLIRDTYGSNIRVFDAEIPKATKAAETSAMGFSIFKHDPNGKVAKASCAGFYNDYSNAETIVKGATTMKLIKLPFKILALPVIALIWLTCFLAKAVTHISCYVIGPFMLLVGIILIVMLTKSRWADVGICGAIEGVCLLALFGVTWMIANMEDLNALLIRFVQS